MIVASPSAKAGNRYVATRPANTEGMPTRIKVTSWTLFLSGTCEYDGVVFSAAVCENSEAMRFQRVPFFVSGSDEDGDTRRVDAEGADLDGTMTDRLNTRPDGPTNALLPPSKDSVTIKPTESASGRIIIV
jgi:hypothetical protein